MGLEHVQRQPVTAGEVEGAGVPEIGLGLCLTWRVMYDEWVKTEYTRGYGLVGHPAMIIGEGEGTVRRAGHSTASNCAMAAKTSIGNAPRLVPPNTLPHTHARTHACTHTNVGNEQGSGQRADLVKVVWNAGCRWWMSLVDAGGGSCPFLRAARGERTMD